MNRVRYFLTDALALCLLLTAIACQESPKAAPSQSTPASKPALPLSQEARKQMCETMFKDKVEAVGQGLEKLEPRKPAFFERCVKLPEEYLRCASYSTTDPNENARCPQVMKDGAPHAKALLLTLVGTQPAAAPSP